MKAPVTWLFPALLLTMATDAAAKNIDLGVGLSYVNMSNEYGIDGGLDFQLGYEVIRNRSLNMGAQLHLTRSLSTQPDSYAPDIDAEGDLTYSSSGLFFTARPHNGWLQLKGGAVQADYATFTRDESRTGYGVGAGLIIEYPGINLHLLDYQRLVFGEDTFNVYTLSFTILH